MHTLWTRVNNVFFFGVTALFCLSVACAITWVQPSPSLTNAAL
jgi:hypothetical protein